MITNKSLVAMPELITGAYLRHLYKPGMFEASAKEYFVAQILDIIMIRRQHYLKR